MRILTKENVAYELISYFKKRDFEFVKIQGYRDVIKLEWNYHQHYSEYYVKLTITEKCEGKFLVRYYTNLSIDSKKIKRISVYKWKTTISKGFNPILKKMIFLKSEMNNKSEIVKNDIDIKNKYSKEIESYYKKIHKRVTVYVNKEDNGEISLSVSATDNHDFLTTYSIIFNTDNKYYLKSISQNYINQIL